MTLYILCKTIYYLIFAYLLYVGKNRIYKKEVRWFFIYLLFSFLFDLIGFIAILNGASSVWGANLFQLTEPFLFVGIFGSWLSNQRAQSIMVITLSVSVWSYELYEMGIDHFFILTSYVNSILFVFFTTYYFLRKIHEFDDQIYRRFEFYICVGFLLFYTSFIIMNGAIYFVGFHDELKTLNSYLLYLLTIIHTVVLFIFYRGLKCLNKN